MYICLHIFTYIYLHMYMYSNYIWERTVTTPSISRMRNLITTRNCIN